MNHSVEQNSLSKRELQQNVTLHQLEVFAATCRNCNYTRAAEELALTQPTVSMQVKHLSQKIGTPLFETIGKRIYLTHAGKEVFKTSQAIFEQLEKLEIALNELKGIHQGKLRLASSRTAKYVIPRLLPAFCQAYPEIEISFKITSRQNVIHRLEHHQDDLYILSNLPESDHFAAYPFADNPFVVVAPIDYPLAQQDLIPIQALNEDYWVLREPGSATRIVTNQHFQQTQ
jgi:LysR family transcriptional regulator, low CO2-responsive transcriptional regulator